MIGYNLIARVNRYVELSLYICYTMALISVLLFAENRGGRDKSSGKILGDS